MEQLNEGNEIESNEELPEINYINKSIISFAKCNKYFFIIFLCPIFCMLSNLFIFLFNENKKLENKEFIMSAFFCLFYFIPGLFDFVYYFKVNLNRKKDSFSNNKNNNSGIIYIYNENISNNFNPCKIILLLILLSLIIEIRSLFFNFIFGNEVFEERFFFFIPLFSKIIFKENIYKHQYFSLIIAISWIIFLLIPVCFKLNTKDIICTKYFKFNKWDFVFFIFSNN